MVAFVGLWISTLAYPPCVFSEDVEIAPPRVKPAAGTVPNDDIDAREQQMLREFTTALRPLMWQELARVRRLTAIPAEARGAILAAGERELVDAARAYNLFLKPRPEPKDLVSTHETAAVEIADRLREAIHREVQAALTPADWEEFQREYAALVAQSRRATARTVIAYLTETLGLTGRQQLELERCLLENWEPRFECWKNLPFQRNLYLKESPTFNIGLPDDLLQPILSPEQFHCFKQLSVLPLYNVVYRAVLPADPWWDEGESTTGSTPMAEAQPKP